MDDTERIRQLLGRMSELLLTLAEETATLKQKVFLPETADGYKQATVDEASAIVSDARNLHQSVSDFLGKDRPA